MWTPFLCGAEEKLWWVVSLRRMLSHPATSRAHGLDKVLLKETQGMNTPAWGMRPFIKHTTEVPKAASQPKIARLNRWCCSSNIAVVQKIHLGSTSY